MTRRLAFTHAAVTDVEDAQEWYENKREGLGRQVVSAVDAALERALAAPEQFPVRYTHFRRTLVRKFPYAVYYTHDDDNVIIHAVMHMARNPTLLHKRGQS